MVFDLVIANTLNVKRYRRQVPEVSIDDKVAIISYCGSSLL